MSRQEFLPFALPEIGDEEIAAVTEVLRSGWLTTGQRTRDFEAAFAQAVGAEHAVAVSSCTAALHLALDAVGVGPGDEVITSPYTFAATGEAIIYMGATPVFADVDPATFNLDPERVAERVTERTRAILPVHIAGLPCDMDALRTLATTHDLAVIDDAAHAFPSRYQGRAVGTLADISCFSFYATKTLTTGEGGMITTDDADLAERCRIMSLHGISKDAWKRYSSEGDWYYQVLEAGYKYNMTDIAAALGSVQLSKSHEMSRRRAEIARRYDEAFGDDMGLQVPPGSRDEGHSHHLYMLRLHLDRLSITRADFIRALKERNIGTSVHFIPLHLHPLYRERWGYASDDYPVAVSEYEREVSLPIYSAMSDADVEDVIAALLEVVARNRGSASAGVA